ncbi:hypothetical protein ACFQYP_20855 [Nonomuraea antimicrobica]
MERVAAVEIVEAFAAQVLAVTDALGLDPLGADADRVCPDGGALALGHPWGPRGRSWWPGCSAGSSAPPPRRGRWGWRRPRSAAGSAWPPCSRWSEK